MKTVGVVIPIYNVEKYLRECLDSVINQTYTNLEIILVNDGSTDENSLNIAKEYTLKDKRITLFDKKNGGLSTARNVGIEYFSGEYKLKNKTQTIKENSLIEFNIEGNNPYEIYTVYKSYKAFNDEKDLTKFTYPIIDYIIFLDSDDYWELNCIEECVPRMDGVDVVWFDFEMFIDETKNKKEWSRLRSFQFLKEITITPKEWLEQSIATKQNEFAFAWGGMINFSFLENIKLKFTNGIIFEDVAFGTILFAQTKNIYILPRVVYNYRIRQNSIMQSLKNSNLSEYLSYMREYFISDSEVKSYHVVISKIITIEKLCAFITSFHNIEVSYLMRIAFFNYLRQWSLEIFNLSKDPMDFFDQVVILTHDLFVHKNKKILYKEANSKDIFIWLSQIITLKNTLLQTKDKTVANQTTQIQNLNNTLSTKTQELTSKTTQIKELNQVVANQTTQIQNLNNTLNKTIKEKDLVINSGINQINQLQNNMQEKITQLNQLQFRLSFQSQHGTAKQRIQNQLSYKLGQTMIINSKNIFGILFMPICIISTILSYRQEQKLYQEKIKKDPSLKLPPLENYPDYKEALKFKNHLSYKLGQALIKANKTWYKGGYVKVIFEIRKLKKVKI
ncbi:glycosyltransferase [Campylobacter coli]|nr:glycosyltransferase [Campylobacter coli]EAK1296055.1 glycosyltransferase [Campylobacter coli]EFN2729224.1 glycosyltransferase [Campylobacter coli]EFU2143972.1 glycosyltransferase [Campylobacter coli]EMD1294653.1 glycosyltransferase [Campylobacter coli]